MEAVAAKATQVATTEDKAGSGQHRQLGAQRSIETERERDHNHKISTHIVGQTFLLSLTRDGQ